MAGRAQPNSHFPAQRRTARRCVWSLRYIDPPVSRDYHADGNAATGELGKAGSKVGHEG